MRLKDLKKPEAQPVIPFQIPPNLMTLPSVDIDVEDDAEENFEVSLVAAVDYLRRANNVLAFVRDCAEEHQLFAEKSVESLGNLTGEIAEFLGEYE